MKYVIQHEQVKSPSVFPSVGNHYGNSFKVCEKIVLGVMGSHHGRSSTGFEP